MQQAYLLEEGATNSLRAKQHQCKRDIPFLLYPKSTSILGRKERTKHKASSFALRRVLAGNLYLFGFSLLVSKLPYLCAVFILIYYWKQYIFNDNLALHMYLYFICSSLEYKIRDGHGVIYVCMGGGEGRARLLGLGPDFFSKRTTVADFFLIFQYKTLNSVQE